MAERLAAWTRLPILALTVVFVVVFLWGKSSQYVRDVDPRQFETSTDLAVYSRVAGEVASGKVPFVHVGFEYPPTVGYYVAAPAPQPPFTRREYFDRFVPFTTALCILGVLSFGALALPYAGLARAVGAVVLSTIALGLSKELTFLRFDAPVALLTACGGLLIMRSELKPRTAAMGGFFLGVAAGLKIYPALLMAALQARLPSPFRKAMILGGAVALIPTVLLILLGPNGVKVFLSYHSQRHIEMGSSWATLGRFLGPWRLEEAFGSAECRFEAERILIPLSSVATLLGSVIPLLLLFKARTLEHCLRLGVLSLYGFVVFNKVGSPQYAFWLLGATLIGVGGSAPRFWITSLVATAGAMVGIVSIENYGLRLLGKNLLYFDIKVFVLVLGYFVATWAVWDAFRRSQPGSIGEGGQIAASA